MKRYLLSTTVAVLLSVTATVDAARFLSPNDYHGSRYQTRKVKSDIHRYNAEMLANSYSREGRIQFADVQDFQAFLALARAANKKTVTHVMHDLCVNGKCNYSRIHEEYNRRITVGE
jgi:hypothetical protein